MRANMPSSERNIPGFNQDMGCGSESESRAAHNEAPRFSREQLEDFATGRWFPSSDDGVRLARALLAKMDAEVACPPDHAMLIEGCFNLTVRAGKAEAEVTRLKAELDRESGNAWTEAELKVGLLEDEVTQLRDALRNCSYGAEGRCWCPHGFHQKGAGWCDSARAALVSTNELPERKP